ncbi:two-component regulator propeller domain-containing protein [Rudanella lutea]|uniref:two-component regulator propeller domain-containing protein n=1 Tax=Rudanella lutea TaxID=451374 RepID=UPI00037C4E33|nr:two-component regulator propeller domain-containing protein [Rudanella lutea]
MRLLFFLFLYPFTLLAQQTQQPAKGWQELTISDGLSQGMIFDLAQDRAGLIWVATKDGLNRFDGYNFTVFTHDPYDEFSVSDNTCKALLLDRKGRLWIGTQTQGLNLYDDRTGRFHHIHIGDLLKPAFGSYEISILAEDPDGNIWAGTSIGKVFKITLPASLKEQFPQEADFTNQISLTQVVLPETKGNLPAFYFSFMPNGQAFVCNSYGAYAFNWRQPKPATRSELLSRQSADFHAMCADGRQTYWFAATDEQLVAWYNGQRKSIGLPQKKYLRVQVKALDDSLITVATTDYLWIMSARELFARDSLTVRDAFAPLPPSVYSVPTLLKDKTGNIWVGTSGYGLRKFNPRVRQFRSYIPNTTLSNLYVDRRGRTYTRVQFAYAQLDRSGNRLLPFLNPALSPADRRQRNFIQARNGLFWVSNVNFETQANTLFKFSEEWQLLKRYPLPAQVVFGFTANQTVEDKDGSLWIGAANGKLLRFDPATEAFQIFSYEDLLPGRGAEAETYALLQDKGNTLWIGTQKGLIKAEALLGTKPKFTLYTSDKANRQSLSSNFVSSIIRDPNQPDRYLWIGTKGGGLERFDKQSGQFAHFTEAQGLPNKVVYGILVDEFRNLWLSTNRGLAQFNPKTYKFRNYTRADGLQDDEFNTGSFVKAPSGELLFGGVNGLTAFTAAEIERQPGPIPEVQVIGLRVNNEPVKVGGPDGILPESLNYLKTLALSYRQNQLTLEFGLMDYTNPAQNRFRYRLEGIDKNWVEAGTNRFANYAQLPAGSYTLQVMGSTDGEVWSKPISLEIDVNPPFYASWWAYTLYAILLLSIAWQLYRFQTQRLLLEQKLVFEQKEAGRLAELDALKTQFFTNISHEIRTPLTLILSPLSDLRKRLPAEGTLELMERNGQRLLTLINQLLDLSKLEAGQLKPELEAGDVAVFFRTLASSFSSLAESRAITFRFHQNEAGRWACFDRDKVEKIVVNLLSNAFKFTQPGHTVDMDVQYGYPTAERLVVRVTDTGIGIAPAHLSRIFNRFYQVEGPKAYEGTGIGLALVKELVQVLGGTIEARSTEGAGTEFTVTLPLIEARQDSEPEFAPVPTLVKPNTTPPEPALPDDAALPEADSEKVLLVIDDNADIRAYVRHVFATQYRILEAVDGLDGLEKAGDAIPDVVICDLMMPRLDGFGFCQQLKTQPATSHIPVVMLTAKATVQDRIGGFEVGADDYLTKPFNADELQVRVRNLIEKQTRLYAWFNAKTSTPSSEAPIAGLPVPEQVFLNRLTEVVTAQLDNAAFTVEDLAETLNLSRVQLHRKLKAITNSTATQFIRDVRLAKAAELLVQSDQNVTQVAYAVGFDNLSYFAKVFQEKYGTLPSQYGKPVA